jgi:hypothetical protein
LAISFYRYQKKQYAGIFHESGSLLYFCNAEEQLADTKTTSITATVCAGKTKRRNMQ